jgi:hypothetical protein
VKVLVLDLHRSTPDLLFGDDRLAMLRRLMEAGLHGRLDGGGADVTPMLRDCFARAGRRTSIVDDPVRGFDEVREALQRDDWDLLVAVADGPGDDPNAYRALDDEVGGLLERLDEETVVLIVSDPGAFLLAGPRVPALGEVGGARAIDLASTLLVLTGLDAPESIPGRSFVSGEDVAAPFFQGYTAAEESALRERLNGLGYI